jgi:hypothetical protein
VGGAVMRIRLPGALTAARWLSSELLAGTVKYPA